MSRVARLRRRRDREQGSVALRVPRWDPGWGPSET